MPLDPRLAASLEDLVESLMVESLKNRCLVIILLKTQSFYWRRNLSIELPGNLSIEEQPKDSVPQGVEFLKISWLVTLNPKF